MNAGWPYIWGRLRFHVVPVVQLSHWLFTESRADPIVQGLLGSAAQMVPFYNCSILAVSLWAAAASVLPTVPAFDRHVILPPLFLSFIYFVVET